MRKDAEGKTHFKIVFFGPSMGGKTTSLKHLYTKVEGLQKSGFTELADVTGRTLFFDFAPMQATESIIFDIYTTAGQERHRKQRGIVLQGADGIIFVADSTKDTLQENIDSINELRERLGPRLGKEIPLIVTLNKRDLPDALPRKKLLAALQLDQYPVYETIATTGLGCKKAFQSLAREILLRQVYEIPI
ncbi:MAG: ATP/GTP-binding protein [Promethearchaeota archaeon]